MYSTPKPLTLAPVLSSRNVSVCFSCLNAYFNGEGNNTEEPDSKPLNKMPEGYWLASLPCAHGYGCGSCDGPSAAAHFARRCDTCNTRWAGSRFDYELVGE